MTDYFSVAAAHKGASPSCQEIEDGLAVVAANVGSYTGQGQHYVGVILQRFVYTDSDRCSPKATSLALGILKAFGRHTSNSSEIASRRAVGGLLELANKIYVSSEDARNMPYTSDICSDALTCVANAMLIHPDCKSYAAERQSVAAIVGILKAAKSDSTVVFLCARCILLLLNTKECAQYCVEQHNLQDVLALAADTYLNCGSASNVPSGRFTPPQVLAEILKAAMGLCTYFLRWIHTDAEPDDKKPTLDDAFPPNAAFAFIALLKVALDTLDKASPEGCHLDSSAKQAIAIAMNFPTHEPQDIRDIWLPSDRTWKHVDTIFGLFRDIVCHIVSDPGKNGSPPDNAASEYQDELAPLALVLVRLVTEHSDVREHLFFKVYPRDPIDFAVLPEDRPGMSAKLVRLMRSPPGGMLPVSSIIGDFLLALLGNDIKQFILTVGYGNAAGYMVARHIEIPADIIEQVNGASGGTKAVNPVTGRYWSQEDINQDLANMTDEEKEREAERLFVLFERLNKTGIIKTENPVRAAVESGRFEELDADTHDDSE